MQRGRCELNQQATSGPARTAWEDVFCKAFGINWRSTRNACIRLSEWKRKEDIFVNAICAEWGLPLSETNNHSLAPNAVVRDGPTEAVRTFHMVPPRVHHQEDTLWDDDGRRLQVIIDCKDLEQGLGGAAALKCPDLRPVRIRISRLQCWLFKHAWLPKDSLGQFIKWRPWYFNSAADHLCNWAMDASGQANHCDHDLARDLFTKGCNLQLYCDGGFRSSVCAATRWVLYVVHRCSSEIVWTRIAQSAVFLGSAQHSLQVEAVALEPAISFVRELISKYFKI